MSHGCELMRTEDVVRIHDHVQFGTAVTIEPEVPLRPDPGLVIRPYASEGAQLRRLPHAAVRPHEALLDPHLAARGFFLPIEHPALGRTEPFPGAPFRLGDLPWRVTAPPRLDEHGAAVVREWPGGMTSTRRRRAAADREGPRRLLV